MRGAAAAEPWGKRPQRLTQRRVESIHRAVPFRNRMGLLVPDVNLYRGFAHR